MLTLFGLHQNMNTDMEVHLCKQENKETCHEAMSIKADCTTKALHLLQSKLQS